jgi:hypothetical protein
MGSPDFVLSQEVRDNYKDQMWRMCNLYWILDKNGKEIPFKPNEAQYMFLLDMHTQNVILKARQRGFSTVIQLFILDNAVFIPNTKGGVIAHTLEDVENIFEDKIKFAYNRLPELIRQTVRPIGDSKRKLELSNGSTIRVGTSMRSGTLQYLHVSEFGKICAADPGKAKEVMTGSLPTVQAGNFWFIESTADGREGPFYDLCKNGEARSQIDRPLSIMEPKFHFYSWYDAEEYQIDPEGVIITKLDHEYFDNLEAKLGIDIGLPRRAWYVLKRSEIGGQENMYQEFPSTPDEAFHLSTEGTYYARQLADARKNKQIILSIPKLPIPVNTFWDVGRSDMTAIWFHQQVGMEHRFIGYYENSGEDLRHYMKILQDTGYLFNQHFLPHDADHKRLSHNNKSIKEMLEELGMQNAEIVPRIDNIAAGIEMTRSAFPQAYFDETECKLGLQRLENYKKRWVVATQTWGDPLHDDNSNGADGFRQWAQALVGGLMRMAGRQEGPTKRKNSSWRTT